MSIKRAGIPRSNLVQLLARCERRVLTLEIEIRQLAKESSISKRQYRRRINRLKRFKKQLDMISQQSREDVHTLAEDTIHSFTVPRSFERTPEETLLCTQSLSQVNTLLAYLVRETEGVVRIAQRAIHGYVLPLLNTLDLAAIKRKLIVSEQRLAVLEKEVTQCADYSAKVLSQSEVPRPYHEDLPDVLLLRNRFLELSKLNKDILSLSVQLESEEDALDVMDKWLSFQEWQVLTKKTPKRSLG